jgi:glutamate synthase (NADPH/NADH)
MEDEGVNFVCNTSVGKDIMADDLREQHDAVVFATGSTQPRDLQIPGRDADGIFFAMDFLGMNTRSLVDSGHEDGHFISAKGKKVIVIGGGDTGNDCIGTSIRHGATSISNFELLPMPSKTGRTRDNPWPQWPRIFRTDYGHNEVAEKFGEDPRTYEITTTSFEKNDEGKLVAVHTQHVKWEKDASGRWQMNKVPGSEKRWEADLVFLSLGFLAPEKEAFASLNLEQDGRGNIKADDREGQSPYKTSVEKVWATGDCRRGQSLVVTGIMEGRSCAAAIDAELEGESRLPWSGGIAKRVFNAQKWSAKGGAKINGAPKVNAVPAVTA